LRTPANPVRAHVVHQDDIALLQCQHEHLLNIGEEGQAIYGAIEHVRGGHPVNAEGGNQR